MTVCLMAGWSPLIARNDTNGLSPVLCCDFFKTLVKYSFQLSLGLCAMSNRLVSKMS